MAETQIVKEWLNKAEEDYLFAAANLKDKNGFYAQICFHFHQASEKFLKAYVVAHDLGFKKIHDLLELLRICREQDEDFSQLKEDGEYLNPFYIETRYPVHWEIAADESVAAKAQEKTEHIRQFVKNKLSIITGEEGVEESQGGV